MLIILNKLEDIYDYAYSDSISSSSILTSYLTSLSYFTNSAKNYEIEINLLTL